MSPLAPLDQLVHVRGRFARSIRLDKDAGHVEQLEGYIPTGRSLEVVRRLTQAMCREGGTRAFSITGPYGSGKSSLALFVDALFGGRSEPIHKAALSLLREYDRGAIEQLREARQVFGAGPSGFVRAVITAPQREPITTTVLRALERGARRARISKRVRTGLEGALARAESDRLASPSHREIRDLIVEISESGRQKPILLVIDEFGKNLEAYAESGREGDLYLLQELAEWATGADALPLVLMTIQHLAFEAYASATSIAKRREWAKVQGRFEDIPFVDSGAATRNLIASALIHEPDEQFGRARDVAARLAADAAEGCGFPHGSDAEAASRCYPLHPTTLLVLPELCARYGQNERTLFSFLASDEPASVTSFLRRRSGDHGLPWVRLHDVYDYFVEAASTFVGASQEAARWVEVETTIRDATGLNEAQLRVLKCIGVLNLVSAGGSLRASNELVAYAIVDGQKGTASVGQVNRRLRELEASGLIVYRDFASEYRIWRGSDFDIGRALQAARHRIRQEPLGALLEEIQPLRPLVAARHTITTGTTRAFARVYADARTALPLLDRRHDVSERASYRKLHGCDGLLVYVVDTDGESPRLDLPSSGLPVLTVTPGEPKPLIDAAVEVAALLEVAQDPNLSADDRAARRELTERTSYARQVLDRTVSDVFAGQAEWMWHNPLNKDGRTPKQQRPRSLDAQRGTSVLSDVFDRVFAKSPPIHYETINRTELTSQGAKARRMLLEAAISPHRRAQERLGLEGDGPEVAMHRAILEDSGIHRGQEFRAPTATEWRPVWAALVSLLRSASEAPIALTHIIHELESPPYGLKRGTADVVLTLGLIIHASEIAIYEHGTFRPRLDAPFSERMLRNPENFAVKHLAVSPRSKRQQALEALASALSEALPESEAARTGAVRPTVLTVTMALVDVLHRRRDDFTRKTKSFHRLWDASVAMESVSQARAVRDALQLSHEPDALLFEELPRALGYHVLPASGRGSSAMTKDEISSFAQRVADAVALVDEAEALLAGHVTDVIRNAADCNTLAEVVSKANDLGRLDVLAPPVRRFADVARLFEAYSDVPAWLGAVTEAVCGSAIRHWTDDTAPAYLERLWQSVSDYARVAELTRFMAGHTDDAFRAFHVQATGQDGVSERGVVSVAERALTAAEETLDRTVSQLAADLEVDSRTAREAIFATLVERFLPRRDAEMTATADHDADSEGTASS